VTGFHHRDNNDGWRVRVPNGARETEEQRPLRNGDLLRLTHVATGRNLHSHSGIRSPVSGQQEVTAFGERGAGDVNCDWRIEVAGNGPLRYGERCG
jgi:dolichyl-phosphate-mannose--protein O-mannosyl transferase